MPPPPLLLHQPQCQQQQPNKEKYLLLVESQTELNTGKHHTYHYSELLQPISFALYTKIAPVLPRSWAGDIPFPISWVLLHLMDSTTNTSSFLSGLWCNSSLRRKHSFISQIREISQCGDPALRYVDKVTLLCRVKKGGRPSSCVVSLSPVLNNEPWLNLTMLPGLSLFSFFPIVCNNAEFPHFQGKRILLRI